jgi:hypothetical protein
VTSNGETKYNSDDMCKNQSGAKTCHNNILEYCSGGDLNEDDSDSSWIRRWMNEDGTPRKKGCYDAVIRNVYYKSEGDYGLAVENDENLNAGGGSVASGNCGAVINEINIMTGSNSVVGCQAAPIDNISDHPKITQANEIVEATMKSYSDDGFILGTLPGMAGYNPFQDFMYKYIFCRFPFLAKDTLKTTCGKYTTSQLETNPSIANLCGCYLRDIEYEKYVNLYQVNPECAPQCNRSLVIPLTDYDGKNIFCDQDTCIVDDVAINLAGSDVNNVNISQICGNCHTPGQPNSPPNAGSSCSCNFTENTFNISQSEFNQFDVNQTCTTSNCTIINSVTGQSETLPCSEVPARRNAINQQQILQEQTRRDAIEKRNQNILIFLGILFIFILVTGYYIGPLLDDPVIPPPRKKKEKKKEKLAPFGARVGYDNLDELDAGLGGKSLFGGVGGSGASEYDYGTIGSGKKFGRSGISNYDF